MANIDIEAPGADTDDLRDALGAQTGLHLLDKVTVSAPVAYLSFALTGGYGKYWLEYAGLQNDEGDNWALALSNDNGATWLIDTNNDSYSFQKISISANGTLDGGQNSDSVIKIISGLDHGMGRVYLYPGSADVAFQGETSGGAWQYWEQIFFSSKNGLPVGRITNIAIFPLGNRDIPPTSGEFIIAGTFT